MADTNYIAHLGGRLRDIVVDCYLSGLKQTYCKLHLSLKGGLLDTNLK